MPSNRLTQRDKEIFEELLQKSNPKIKEADLWIELLTSSELKNINRIKNRLQKTLSRYISLYQLDSNQAIQNLLLSEYFTEKLLEKNALSTLNKGITQNQKDPNFYRKAILFWLYQLFIYTEKDVRKPEVYNAKIVSMKMALNEFYACNSMRIICEQINRHLIINGAANYDELSAEAERMVQISDSEHLRVYHDIFLLLTKRENTYLQKIEAYLNKYEDQLKLEYLREIYAYLMNYCIRRLNSGNSLYARSYISYIKKLEQKGILLDNQTMGIGRLQNSITAAIIINEDEWALDFLEKYTPYLYTDSRIDRTSFIKLNRAIIEMNRGDVDKCFEYANDFKNTPMYNKDVYYRIYCDKLLLKTHVIYKNTSIVDSMINTIRNYIRSKQNILKGATKKNLDFLKIIKVIKDGKYVQKNDMIVTDLLLMDKLWLQKYHWKE
ncbi:MAG: hypothetical protein MI974_16560 [Chitinophagales bacterium]|nr:hypothetical protein [Chitinophagales bacterium]